MNNLRELAEFLITTKWTFVAYVFPLLLFLLIFYLKNKLYIFSYAKRLLRWLRPSFETNGKPAPEKLTAFEVLTCCYVPGRLLFCLTVSDPVHLLYGSILDAVFVSVLYGIISPQQIIELKNGTTKTE